MTVVQPARHLQTCQRSFGDRAHFSDRMPRPRAVTADRAYCCAIGWLFCFGPARLVSLAPMALDRIVQPAKTAAVAIR